MTMAVRMILLVCLGNIYPGARSQLGGSGKWVITVSGCSPPPPLLFLCAVLQIHILLLARRVFLQGWCNISSAASIAIALCILGCCGRSNHW